MATLVTDYRYIMLYETPIIRHTLVPFVIGCVVLVVGWWTFRRVAPAFAEEV
jgi:ABC-type polysaccharide/polyol phosphate export permease